MEGLSPKFGSYEVERRRLGAGQRGTWEYKLVPKGAAE